MTTSSAHATPSNPRGLKDLPFPLPEVTRAQKDRARRILKALRETYPDAHCELDYTHPHELVIATILSAQATDVGVNKATPKLFGAFPEPSSYAEATPKDIEPYIKTIGLYRNKAKAVHAAMNTLVDDFDSVVPDTMDELLTLRGVARKTANVVLGNAFNINVGFVVDTHVERISKRLGLVPEDATVAMTERYLCALLPRDSWCDASHMLIFHGRRACKARLATHIDNDICKRFGSCNQGDGGG
ncbi:MAG: endonuclease III [Planctomycetota bacterium]